MTDPRQEPPFIHSHALVESEDIGPGTRIWAFAHVLRGAIIGADCNVCDHSYIDEDVVIGDRVTIKGQVAIIDGMRIEDDVFIGPNATFTNDRFPRSRREAWECTTMVIGRGASIGSGAVFLPGVNVGEGAMVGAGAASRRTCRRSRSSSAIPPGWSVRLVTTNASPSRLTRERPRTARSPHRLGVDGRARGD